MTKLHAPGTPLPVLAVRGPDWLSGTSVDLAVADGSIFPLSPCCQATGKGTVNADTGVCCRRCYAELPSEFGDCARTADRDKLERFLVRWGVDPVLLQRVANRIQVTAVVNAPVTHVEGGR